MILIRNEGARFLSLFAGLYALSLFTKIVHPDASRARSLGHIQKRPELSYTIPKNNNVYVAFLDTN